MAQSDRIIGLASWLATPAGRYLLDWEQQHLDQAVADVFGFHALQLGLPELDALRSNRMPHRWVASDERAAPDVADEALPRAALALQLDYDALPFDSASLDLVVLPHTLELAQDPHQTLREVERVLVPEGSVVISGFNPLSLWGLRRLIARRGAEAPWSGHYRSAMRIRDWLNLLGFEIQESRFGCYAPPLRTPQWLERWGCLDRAGSRWWPVLGAGYLLHGVKRVQGMRLITPHWRGRKAAAKRLSPVAQRDGSTRNMQ